MCLKKLAKRGVKCKHPCAREQRTHEPPEREMPAAVETKHAACTPVINYRKKTTMKRRGKKRSPPKTALQTRDKRAKGVKKIFRRFAYELGRR